MVEAAPTGAVRCRGDLARAVRGVEATSPGPYGVDATLPGHGAEAT
ncbi:hypothetical protein [Actinoallomurus acanthiterrae]